MIECKMKIMYSIWWILFICPSLLLVRGAYHDEAGLHDWHRQFLGTQLKLQFQPYKSVACGFSEQNTYGCLDSDSGQILWRKQEVQNQRILQSEFVQDDQPMLVVLSSSGLLQAWDAQDGVLRWEQQICQKQNYKAQFQYFQLGGEKVFATLCDTQLKVIYADNGRIQQQTTAPSDDTPVLTTSQEDLSVLILSKSQTQRFSLSKSLSSLESTPLTGTPVGGELLAAASSIAVVKSANGQHCLIDSESNKGTCYDVEALLGSSGAVTSAFVSQNGAIVFNGVSSSGQRLSSLYTCNQGSLAYLKISISGGGEVPVPAGPAASSYAAVASNIYYSDNGAAINMIYSQGNELYSCTVDIDAGMAGRPVALRGGMKSTVDVGDIPDIAQAFVGLDGADRIILIGEDQRIVSYKNGAATWRSDAGLSTVGANMQFVDLPKRGLEDQEALMPPPLSWTDRVKSQILQLKVEYKLHEQDEADQLSRMQSIIRGKNSTLRDTYGARKLVVVCSGYNTISALHTGDGRTIWQRYMANLSGDLKIVQWRTGSPDIHDGVELAVISTGTKSSAAQIAVLDAFTGKLVSTDTLDMHINTLHHVPKVQSLAQMSVDHVPIQQHLYIATSAPNADGEMKAVLVPSQPHMGEHVVGVNLQDVDYQQGTIRGYMVSSVGPNNQVQLQNTWTYKTPRSGTLYTVAHRSQRDQPSQYIKIERLPGSAMPTIRFKYTNPHVLLAVHDTGVGGGQGEEEGLTAALIDGVTGHVLHMQSHSESGGPVHAVLTDNLVMYHYWNNFQGQWELSVMEMFENMQHRFSEITIPNIMLGKFKEPKFSSWSHTPLKVNTETWIGRSPITSMSTTVTARGITQRNVLLSMEHGQTYSMDVRLVDPKRRKIPQVPTKGKTPPPVSPVYPLIPFSYATLGQQVFGIRGVNVDPTPFESSCLVLSYGTDLFMARLQPSGRFDALAHSFPFALLIITASSMAILSAVLHYMAKSAQVNAQWA